VRRMVEELEVQFETGSMKMTICAGVAQLNPACGWEEMTRRADAAMYDAKKRGRNLICALPESGIDRAKTSGGVSVDGRDLLTSP